MSNWPISTPAEFEPTGEINFNATGGGNTVKNFVTSDRGDIVYCLTGGATNTLSALPIGATNRFLKAGTTGLPIWANADALSAIKNGTVQTINGSATFPDSAAIITGWQLTNGSGTGGYAHDSFSPSGPLNTTTGLFTVPATGVYFFDVQIQYIQNAGSGYRSLAFVLSPSPGPGTIISHIRNQPGSSTTLVLTLSTSTVLSLNANDVIGVELKGSTAAADIDIQPGSRWSIVRIQ